MNRLPRRARLLTFAVLVMLSVGALCAAPKPARAEDIVSVLQRSDATRLATMMPALSLREAAVRVLSDDFERLLDRVGPSTSPMPELRIVGAGTVAETLHGRVVVVNVALAEWPREARSFVMAHELYHVRARHWSERLALYQRFIPGEVRQIDTDAVAAELGRAASRQSHAHEQAADAFALNLLLDIGYDEEQLMTMFRRIGNHPATPTHPSLGQRLAHLRQIVARRALASRAAGDVANEV